jgi:signal transduction histidine kinase
MTGYDSTDMWRTVVVLALTSFAVAIVGCAQRQPPLEATLHWESEDFYVGAAVLDSAGSPGLANIQDDRYVQLSNLHLQPVTSTPFMNHGTFGPKDMAGARGRLVWATCKRHDSLFIVDVFRCHEMFVTSGIDRVPEVGWDGRIRDVLLSDINADGKMEAVVVVWSGDAGGRGIYVLDWMTGEPLWHYRIGPSPTNVLLRDVDGDGKTEILLGTLATGNGDSANSTDDFHTYVLLLKSNGERGWIQPIGKHSSFVMVPWLADSSSLYPSVLATEIGYPAGERTRDGVFVLDSRDGSVTARAHYGTYNTMQAVVSDKVGMSVLLGGADDTLRSLDPVTLKLRNKAAMPCGVSSPNTTGGNSIGSGLAVVPTTDSRLLVVSPSPRVECAISSGAAQGVHPIAGASVPTFLAEGVTGGRRVWRLYSVAPRPVLHRQVGVDVMVAVSLLLVAMFGAALVAIRYRQTYDMRTVIRGLTGQSGVVELGLRGNVRHTNPKARELLGGETLPAGPLAHAVQASLTEPPGSSPKELPVALGGKTVLARATRVRSGVMLTLEDISAVEYLKRVSTWVPVAQRLAHDIKNPLTAISLTLQRVEQATGPGSQRYVESMRDDIDRLKKMADGFMRLTKLEPPKLVPADVNEVVRECVGRFQGVKPAGIEFKYELAEGMPRLALDRDQMAVALSNVIENAISAMGDVGRLVIRSSFAESRKLIAVSVSDTGKGIPERYLKKVFEPYFTLKPGGTGLGMALTKRIIEDHKGTIVIESVEGKGTTVTITLPAA